MKKIFKYFAKKYAVNAVNEALKAFTAKKDITVYKDKAAKAINVLKTLSDALEDDSISNDEAAQITEHVKALFS